MQLLPAPFPFLNNGSSYRWNLLEKHRSSSTRWTSQLNLGHLQTVPPITWPWTEYLPWKASLFSYQSFVHNISLASSLQLRGQHRSKRKTVGMKEEKPISCSMHIIVVASFTSEQPKKLMVVLPTWTSFVSCLSMRPSITQVVLVVKNLLANAGGIEMWVWSLDQEDPLATHSRRKWLPTPVFLPGESHRQRSLVGYSPWGRKEWETTERTFVFELWCWKRLSRGPLDGKEIQPAHPKGNQSWIFIERTDVEAETPILWPPDAENWLIGKDPDAGEDWTWKEKRTTQDEIVGWHHWLNGHEFE